MEQGPSEIDRWLWLRGQLLSPATTDKSYFRATMSNMATSPAHDTVDNIARIQELLNQDIERVNELEALLATAKQQVEQRKQELAEYQAAAARAVARTSINDCPPEILCLVFKLSMPKDALMQHTGRLLRVCKRWHSLVINDPGMWNHIAIISPDRWDILSWARSTRSYLKLCVERSRASRLNIELNFTILKTAKRRLIERLHSGFFNFPSASQSEGVHHTFLEEWLDNQDYSDLEYDPFSITRDCLPQYVTSVLRVLTDSEVMRRWESLTICFPYNQLAADIWESIASHASGLAHLHIVGSNWEDLRESYGDGDEEPSLWAIPRVEVLKMKALIGWESFLSFDPSSIQSLAVDLAFKEGFFSQLARFSHLRILTLSSPGIIEDLDVDASATNRISIPTLEELVLIGEFHYLDTVNFDLPNLKRMRMEFHGPVSTQPAIPTIQPLEVHWAADSTIFFCEEILETADKDIRGFLLSYKSSDRFSVASFLKENVLKVLKELSMEGVLPPKWRTVVFHDNYGGIEVMQINAIVDSDQD